MKTILTSTLGGSTLKNEERIPTILEEKNGQLDKIKSVWTDNAKVMMICASPSNHKMNDSLYKCFREAFLLSRLSFSSFEICDDRNKEAVERVNKMNVIILAGGHVPTQNKFIKEINLKDKMNEYDETVIAWSAGSMNCAEAIYAGPEEEGEAVDPDYKRWMSGLGMTKINVFPHFQMLKDEVLDGLRLIEDITYADSMGHEFLALNDGSYIVIEDGVETLYGEAYRIKDGSLTQICKNDESIILK